MTVPTLSTPAAAGPVAAKKGTPAEPGADVPVDAFAALLAGVAVPLPTVVPMVVPAAPVTTPDAEPAGTTSPAAAGTATPVGQSPTVAAPTSSAAPTAAVPTSPPQAGALPVFSVPVALPAPAPSARPLAPRATTEPQQDQPVPAPPGAAVPDVPPVPQPPVPADATTTAPVPTQAAQVTSPAPATGATEALPVQGSTRHVRPALLEAAKHLRSEGGKTSLVIRLDPPELGAVLVRLTVRHGQVDVQLRTPDLAARGDLQAQALDVKQVLREQGLDLATFDVAHGDVLTSSDSRSASSERQTPDRATPRPRGQADGHPSTAHVMDDVPSPQPAGTWL